MPTDEEASKATSSLRLKMQDSTTPGGVPAGDAPSVSPDPFALIEAPLRATMTKRGFTALTEVQSAVLAADATTHDLRISSRTGSGKTVAIGLALGARLLATAGRRDLPGPTTLVIAPTRELADQVAREFTWLFAEVAAVQADSVTGGTSVLHERRRLERRPRILVGTPGRLLDHIQNGAVNLSAVDQLVLDEADQMLDLGFRDELDSILEALPAERRTHLVSATFPNEVMDFVERIQKDAVSIAGTPPGEAHADIEHIACVCHPRDRYDALVNLLLMTEGERTLVFVRTRQDTATVAEQLAEDGFAAMAISGDMAQPQRTRTLQAFRRGIVTALVATDVAARGIDVPEITQVVHLDLPMDSATYTHRSGRTGRAGRKGRSVMLVPPGARRRAFRIHDEARIDASWRDVPGPEPIQRMLDERVEGRLMQLVGDEGPQASANDLGTAERLLEGRDPKEVVARLLAKARPRSVCAPREIEVPMQPRTRERDRAHGPDRPVRREAPRRAPAQRTEGFVSFVINWGSQQGANPKRLLAHICRRGGITGDRIGSIDVAPRGATFEVDRAVARAFATRARTPDRRDPHLIIRPVDEARVREA
jgi:ATP-dependent RNA helicase DeaD